MADDKLGLGLGLKGVGSLAKGGDFGQVIFGSKIPLFFAYLNSYCAQAAFWVRTQV